MPRTRFDSQAEALKRPQVPPANYLAELFGRYRRALGLTSDELGKILGVSGAAVRAKLSKAAGTWTVWDVAKYAAALRVPLPDALDAAARSLEVKM